jgi:predicted nucleic-acid-binding Zn-ribbon protein
VSVLAVTDHERTLAVAVDELLVLARNQAGGACVWCGSRNVHVSEPRGVTDVATDDHITITCRHCGAELQSERTTPLRSRWA